MDKVSNASGTLVATQAESFYSNLTAGTALVKSGPGTLVGLTVNSHSSGVIRITDGTTFAGTLMHSSISFGAGERTINFFGERFANGLIVNIGGTADVTIAYR